jgi:hypothetical protein
MRRFIGRVLSLTVLLALPLSSAFAASAYVHELRGTMTGQYGTAAPRALKIGDTLDAGITLSTGANSTAVVKFEDGQLVVLQPNTRFAVREYSYNSRQVRNSNVVFALLQGGLRFVTGVIGATNRNAFKLNVGTATIGVRGTDGVVTYDDIANIIMAATNAGAIDLQNQGIVTNIATGQFTTGSLAAPLATTVIALATPAVRNSLAQAASVRIPINTPVVVEASARAAAAQEAARVAAIAAAAPGATDAQKALAAQAAELARATLQTAINEAVNAFNAALQGGAQIPAPPAPTGPAAAQAQQQQLENVLKSLAPTPTPTPTPVSQ